MDTQLQLKVTGHWISNWFLRIFATPVALIDGQAHTLRWGEFSTLPVVPGRVEVGVGVRYGNREVLGSMTPLETAHLDIAPGQTRRFEARNGVLNHSPFSIYEAGPAVR